MKISQIVQLLEANVISETVYSENEVKMAFSSDLMSDVLTLDTNNLLMITGLINIQTIRTAEMAEIKNILFVRNKMPTSEMIDLANKENIVLLVSKKSMFHASGLLFKAGLNPVY
jgi:hypothetical protein